MLGAECTWLQTADNGGLRLAAGRGLTPAMEAQLTGLGRAHPLRQMVLGRGETASFPDLASADGAVPAAFRQAGLRWLVAAPLMTHRAGGILGVASVRRKTYDRDLPTLVRTVGGMIGGALQRARLDTLPAPDPDVEIAPPPGPPAPEPSRPPREETFFERHRRRMALFRSAHAEPPF